MDAQPRQPRWPARRRQVAVLLAATIGMLGVAVIAPTAANALTTQTLFTKGVNIAPGSSVNSGQFAGSTHALNYYFKLELETTGDLRLYNVLTYQSSQTQIWASDSGDLGTTSASYANLDSTGNLVVHGARGSWQSGTGGLGVTQLNVSSDGNMNLVISTGGSKWTSRYPYGNCKGKSSAVITNGRVSTILSSACRLWGTPYCLGAGGLNGRSSCGIDCSGLTMYAIYRAVFDVARGENVALYHHAGNQYGSSVTGSPNDVSIYGASRISLANVLPGDLVFYRGADGSTADPEHVGIAIGNGWLIDAYNDGVPVQAHQLSWENTNSSGYVGIVRYWNI